jgi:hypothetical protein
MRKNGLESAGPGGTMAAFLSRAMAVMFVLHIGNKNYSSWSMRSWVAMTAFGIPFEERPHWLDTPEFAQLSPLSPVAKVPVLEDGDLRIWDSLAIGEYLAERFPELALWPQDVAERALARSLCASMHSGFGALREHMVMNIEADLPGRGWNPAVQRDIDQILRNVARRAADQRRPLPLRRIRPGRCVLRPGLHAFCHLPPHAARLGLALCAGSRCPSGGGQVDDASQGRGGFLARG